MRHQVWFYMKITHDWKNVRQWTRDLCDARGAKLDHEHVIWGINIQHNIQRTFKL